MLIESNYLTFEHEKRGRVVFANLVQSLVAQTPDQSAQDGSSKSDHRLISAGGRPKRFKNVLDAPITESEPTRHSAIRHDLHVHGPRYKK